MSKARRLGLVGGLGVGATVHYYQSLAKAHQDNGLTLDIVITHAETSRVYEYLQADDREGLAGYLLGFIQTLHAAGAELVAIPAVTPHFCIRELVERSPIPLINLFDSLNELAARKISRVAVFGTRFVIQSALFGFLSDVEVISPEPEEVALIHDIYTELAQTGAASSDHYNQLTSLAHTLCTREKLDAILIAGTDLSLIFNEQNIDFPYIDCAALHLQDILNRVS
jgi:aspartate racemase